MTNLSQPQIGGNEFFIQISKNLGYLKSYNYDLFSFYPTNRVPTHWRKILESIELQDLTDRQPILVYKCPVTQKLFISDGQNRFLACRSSKRPIYAMVVIGEPLTNGEACLSVLNSYQKNWSKDDFLEYYCTKGFEDYKRLRAIKDETGFTLATLLRLWSSNNARGKFHQGFSDGSLKFPVEAAHRARIVKRCYDSVLKNKLSIVEIKSKGALQIGILAFLIAGANSTELTKQLQKYGNMVENCSSARQYFNIFNHLYNYRKREANKVFFDLKKGGMSVRRTLK